MGVIYKLNDEIVQFIISQRQANPLYSCRQLAESVAKQFGVQLSKSSVNDVLKESGVKTPRGRKPKDSFQIPVEKKKQIQESLSKVLMVSVPPPVKEPQPIVIPLMDRSESITKDHIIPPLQENPVAEMPFLIPSISIQPHNQGSRDLIEKETTQISVQLPEGCDIDTTPKIYKGAGGVFLKAAVWDLGIYQELGQALDNFKEVDWKYFLTYTTGVKVVLENNDSYMIDWLVPLHRGICEVVDGLISNIKPFRVNKVSNEELFRSSMEAKNGFKIKSVAIVDKNYQNICIFDSIVERKRNFELTNMFYMESYSKSVLDRTKELFFSKNTNIESIKKITELEGFEHKDTEIYSVNICNIDTYENSNELKQAVELLNSMYLRDENNRLLKVNVK